MTNPIGNSPQPEIADIGSAAVLYVAGALHDGEHAAFERLLAQGHADALAAVAKWKRLIVPLALRAGASPVGLDERPAAHSREPRPSAEAGEWVLYRAEERWRPAPVPGVTLRLLFADWQRGRMTLQVRLEAGTRYPAHTHAEEEECFIIEGDLSDQRHQYRTGDYFRAAAGSRHEDLRSATGCVCLVVTALDRDLAEICGAS